MATPVGRLEFGISCLADIRYLWKAWQQFLVREDLEASESGLVHIIVEDRRPGEEVMLCFHAAEAVLQRFLQSLKEQRVKFTCNEVIQGILTICRIIRDRGVVQVIGPRNGSE